MAIDARVLLVRYRDLVQRPEAYFRRVLEYIGARFTPGCVAGVHSASVGKYADLEFDDETETLCSGLMKRLDATYERQLRRQGLTP